jgi:hypothetical protein
MEQAEKAAKSATAARAKCSCGIARALRCELRSDRAMRTGIVELTALRAVESATTAANSLHWEFDRCLSVCACRIFTM